MACQLSSQKKRQLVAVGIAAFVIGFTVAFTNVDDLAYTTIEDVVSQIGVTNPLQTYEINTKQDFVCMQLYGAPSYLNYLEHQNDPEYLRQKYPEIIEEIEAYYLSGQLQRDSANKNDGGLTDRQLELLLPMLMNEWSVNPSLKNWLFDVMSGRLSPSELYLLEQFCEEKIIRKTLLEKIESEMQNEKIESKNEETKELTMDELRKA